MPLTRLTAPLCHMSRDAAIDHLPHKWEKCIGVSDDYTDTSI